MNINLYTTAMIYKALQTIAFFIIAIPLTGQDMFPVRQLTLDPAQQGFNTWSPDGKKISFTRTQGRNFDIWVMDVNNKIIKRDLQKLARP
jgi:hypothetical protein